MQTANEAKATDRIGTPAMNADGSKAYVAGQIGIPAMNADGNESKCCRPDWHSCMMQTAERKWTCVEKARSKKATKKT